MMLQIRSTLTAAAVLLLMHSGVAEAEVVSSDEQIRGVSGRVRYHYDDAVEAACESVVMIGVGTGMKTTDYDLLSSEIATDSSVVTVIMDANPWWFVKTNPRSYANLANAIVERITDIVPSCKVAPPKGFIIGGHSASGQAALGAMPHLLAFEPVGFLGLDPFRMNGRADSIELPAMFWGFTETTCRVNVNQAALGGYRSSNEEQRVFYQVENPGGSVGHCIFTDSGCFGAICPANQDESWVRASVGDAVERFVEAISSGDFSEKQFELDDGNNVNLFVNEDEVGAVRVRNLRGVLPAYA